MPIVFSRHPDIKDAADFEGYCEEWLNDFLEKLSKVSGMTRAIEEDDPFDEWEVSFVWSGRASCLAQDAIGRFYALGEKTFPNDCITINTTWFREP